MAALEHVKLLKSELYYKLETEKKISQGKSWQLEKYEKKAFSELQADHMYSSSRAPL